MKLSKQQLEVLTRHVLAEVGKKNLGKVTSKEKADIEKYANEHLKIDKEVHYLYEKQKKMTNTIREKYFKGNGIYSYTAEALIDQLKKFRGKPTPQFLQIQNDIVIKNLFSSEKDVDKLLKDLIAKY